MTRLVVNCPSRSQMADEPWVPASGLEVHLLWIVVWEARVLSLQEELLPELSRGQDLLPCI